MWKTEYYHELNNGQVIGIRLFDIFDNKKIADIRFYGSNEAISIRSRYTFPGWQTRWDWDQDGGIPHPERYEFGDRFQYEAIARHRNPLGNFSPDALRDCCIKLFDVDPGDVPEPLSEEEKERRLIEIHSSRPPV